MNLLYFTNLPVRTLRGIVLYGISRSYSFANERFLRPYILVLSLDIFVSGITSRSESPVNCRIRSEEPPDWSGLKSLSNAVT